VGVIAVARDFTKHKQAEEALRVSEERFRLALKSTPVVVFSHDRQLRYTWMSSPNFPVRPENYLGRTDTEVFPGKEGARLTAIKEEVLRTGVGSHTEVTVTLQGEVHDFDLVVQRLSDAKEKLLGLLCSAIDITSLKQTIGRLRQALNEIQVMRGLLPTCASCHRIKDERGDWQPMEGYIQAHSKAKFSHGVCPDCLKKLYPDYYP
jgi:PAS domain S-box-containing protein